MRVGEQIAVRSVPSVICAWSGRGNRLGCVAQRNRKMPVSKLGD